MDAIEQISVATAPYDVSQSGFTGASIDAVTKSGTNEVAGTVYGYFRNQDLTGSKVKGEKIFVPDLEQIQYGVSVGGPIVKDKLFFFANFESDDRTDLGQSWLPNNDNGSLDINESRVLESDLMAVQSALDGIGYNTGAYQGFTHDTKSIKGIFKLDWNINEKHRAAFIYNFLDASQDKTAHPTALGFRGPSFSMLQFENSGYEMNNKIQSFQVELNSTFSDNATNKLRVGYTHFDDFRTPKSEPMPAFRIMKGGSNYIVAGHEPFSIHNTLDQKVFQISDNFNYFLENHTITAGFSFEKFEFDNSFNLGAYGFGDDRGYVGAFFGDFADMDAFNTAISNGLLADAMANAESVYSNNNAAGEGVIGSWSLAETNVGQLAFYLQDEFSISDNFTLTYGVRIDKPLYFDTDEKAQEVIDRSFGYVPDIPYYNPNTGEEVLLDNTKMPTDSWMVSPRLGMNWDVLGDKTFQVRGGTGIFTGRLPFVWIGNQIANPNVWFYQMVDPDFQFPQVFRTSLGTDVRFENGLVWSNDFVFTKDINGAHVQNWGLRPPSERLNGVGDRRPYYAASDLVNNGYVFTNSSEGRSFNFSTKLQKSFDNGLFTSLAYNYLDSKDVNSIEAEITGDAFAFNPTLGDANAASLSHSKYGDKHRILGTISKAFNYGSSDQWTTTVATFFEYAQGGRFNYTYGGDINNDGSGINDLIYIPTASELGSMNFPNVGDAAAFEEFIQQDDYLSEHRGEYFKRYGALAPWRGKWDLKVMQELKLNNGHRIEFSANVLNVGNMINSDWGLVQLPANQQPLGVSVDPVSLEPTYTFNSDSDKTFVYDSSLISRWQAQFGLRYSF